MDGIEERLKKQEQALEALKDVPNLLSKLIKKKPENPKIVEKGKWSLGLSESDDESDHDDVQDLLSHGNQSKDEPPQTNEIEMLLEDIEKGAELGPEIMSNVADSFLKTVNRPLSKDSNSKLRNNLKVPSNCKDFIAPKINNEIWRLIPSHSKLRDVKQQQTQQALGSGLSALAMITNEVLLKRNEIPKEVVSSIVRITMDAANIMGNESQQLNLTRRMELKKYLNPEYAGICTAQMPHSEWLFGNELTESLKQSKATSSLIKNTAARPTRFNPYNRTNSVRPSSSGTLNFSRPFRQHRGNGQFYRPQNYRQNQSNSSPMWKSNQFQRPPRM